MKKSACTLLQFMTLVTALGFLLQIWGTSHDSDAFMFLVLVWGLMSFNAFITMMIVVPGWLGLLAILAGQISYFRGYYARSIRLSLVGLIALMASSAITFGTSYEARRSGDGHHFDTLLGLLLFNFWFSLPAMVTFVYAGVLAVWIKTNPIVAPPLVKFKNKRRRMPDNDIGRFLSDSNAVERWIAARVEEVTAQGITPSRWRLGDGIGFGLSIVAARSGQWQLTRKGEVIAMVERHNLQTKKFDIVYACERMVSRIEEIDAVFVEFAEAALGGDSKGGK